MEKYFGFADRDNVAWEFAAGEGNRYEWKGGKSGFTISPDFPTDDEIVFAAYGSGSYEGWAFVVFERGGKVYEVHGSHCSCYGLEGQWDAEETTWEYLVSHKVVDSYEYDGDAVETWQAIVATQREILEERKRAEEEARKLAEVVAERRRKEAELGYALDHIDVL